MTEYKLKDLLTIQNGKDYKNNSTGDVPVYGTGGIMTYTDKFLYDGESILLPRKGTLDNIMYVKGKFWTVDTIYWTKINTNIAYPKYLYCYLSLLDLSCRDSGSTLPSMTFDSYYTLDIKLPNIDIQKEIGDKIFNIVNKISLNNSICSDLEAMAKQLYDYWFVQFDFPDENGKPYKSSGGKMVWNEELKREIPEGWKVGNFSELANFTMGQSPKGDNYNTECKGLPLINGAAELSKDGIHISKYTEEYRRICEKNEWLFCIRATLGNIQLSDKRYCLGRGVASARPKQDTKEYCYFLLNEMINYYEQSLSGSIIVGMTKEDIIDYKVIIPTTNIISGFNRKIKASFNKRFQIEEENQQLTSLRDFLLPMLMNGQVKVANI